MKKLNLVGQVFDRLTVQSQAPNVGSKVAWYCSCSCGGSTVAMTSNLRKGTTTSCGCVQKERTSETKTTHGKTHSSAYNVWVTMIQRCENPKNHKYHLYGGRGIKVCDRWLHSFENFYEDMGDRPASKTLNRIDNDGPYSPENCEWASQEEQQNNRRDNRLIVVDGVSMTLAQVARKTGIPRQVIAWRLDNGWDLQVAITCKP